MLRRSALAVSQRRLCIGRFPSLSKRVEKLIQSKMMLPRSNRRIHSVHRHLGMAVAGLAADGRQTVARAKADATNYESFKQMVFLVGRIRHSLCYYFHIRRSLLNEDEYGFQEARRLIYYDDEGLEQKTRETLNTKLSQPNAAINNVSTRLRGGNNTASVPAESDSEVEATM